MFVLKRIKFWLALLLFMAVNFSQIECRYGTRCTSLSQCDPGEQCYNGICTKRCSSEADCAGLPGRHLACSEGYCQ